MEVGGLDRKQSKVGCHHALEAGPGALGLLRVDGTGAQLDAERAAGDNRLRISGAVIEMSALRRTPSGVPR
jgi:hypothetical protein